MPAVCLIEALTMAMALQRYPHMAGTASSLTGVITFGLGAASASFVFFFSLGYGARLIAPLLKKPSAWQIIEITIGATMWAIALGLILSA